MIIVMIAIIMRIIIMMRMRIMRIMRITIITNNKQEQSRNIMVKPPG